MDKETLEELKAIISGAPKGSEFITKNNCYVKSGYYYDGFSWVKCEHFITMRSLSDIERIIELME